MKTIVRRSFWANEMVRCGFRAKPMRIGPGNLGPHPMMAKQRAKAGISFLPNCSLILRRPQRGIAPLIRRRSRLAVTLAEREETPLASLAAGPFVSSLLSRSSPEVSGHGAAFENFR